MLKTFRHYFRPSDDELRTLWREAIIACDASVLLNVYGYSDQTREELLRVLEGVGSRVKVPFQFGLEYSRNRPKVILKQVGNYYRVEKALNDLNSVNFAPQREHPFLSPESTESFRRLLSEMEAGRKRVDALLNEDPYAKRILKLFEGKVGPAPSEAELKQMHSDAKTRYTSQIPPGFADLKEKGEPDAFGDYVGWRQLMEISKAEKRDVLLITDDTKEDWWHYEKERLLGPRPDLIGEFHRVAKQNFYMYNSERFLELAAEYLDQRVAASTLKEIGDRLAGQREPVGKKPGSSTSTPNSPMASTEKPLDLKPVEGEVSAKPSSPPDIEDDEKNLKSQA